MTDITREKVRALFDYNATTGDLIWRNRPRSEFKTDHAWIVWNKRFAGQIAGTNGGASGYWTVRVDGKSHRAHRLVWLWWNVDLPDQIDHINHDRQDNRIENLRATSDVENHRNESLSSNNSSGIAGVRLKKRKGRSPKWVAFIRVNYRQIHLGQFDRMEEAIAARKAAEAEYGFHENHGATLSKVIEDRTERRRSICEFDAFMRRYETEDPSVLA